MRLKGRQWEAGREPDSRQFMKGIQPRVITLAAVQKWVAGIQEAKESGLLEGGKGKEKSEKSTTAQRLNQRK